MTARMNECDCGGREKLAEIRKRKEEKTTTTMMMMMMMMMRMSHPWMASK